MDAVFIEGRGAAMTQLSVSWVELLSHLGIFRICVFLCEGVQRRLVVFAEEMPLERRESGRWRFQFQNAVVAWGRGGLPLTGLARFVGPKP